MFCNFLYFSSGRRGQNCLNLSLSLLHCAFWTYDIRIYVFEENRLKKLVKFSPQNRFSSNVPTVTYLRRGEFSTVFFLILSINMMTVWKIFRVFRILMNTYLTIPSNPSATLFRFLTFWLYHCSNLSHAKTYFRNYQRNANKFFVQLYLDHLLQIDQILDKCTSGFSFWIEKWIKFRRRFPPLPFKPNEILRLFSRRVCPPWKFVDQKTQLHNSRLLHHPRTMPILANFFLKLPRSFPPISNDSFYV